MLVKYKLTERYLFQSDTKCSVATSAGFYGGRCWDQEDSEVGSVMFDM